MRAAGGATAIVGAVAGGLLAGPFGIRAMLFVAAAGILVENTKAGVRWRRK